MEQLNYEVCILGAGPAGLAAALELTKKGINNIIVIDRNSKVGGLARTEVKDGTRFDVGPHRFFTKNVEVNKLWHDTLKEDFRPVNRITRIYYKHKYFKYPINPLDVFSKLGFFESTEAILGYINSRFSNYKQLYTFEDWIVQKFGRKLYETFFKTYTEKVWGIPCNQISAEWAAQRIKGLDIINLLKNNFITQKKSKAKTLVEQFDYPLLGAGQMYEAWSDTITTKGVEIFLDSKVEKFIRDDQNKILSIEFTDSGKNKIKVGASHFFNSIPITHFFKMLSPEPEEYIMTAAESLYYREHITVDLLLNINNIFPDQWIYIHSPDVQMARIANYNNFSHAMVSKKNSTALSIEYFVFQKDKLWKYDDKELIDLAISELVGMQLIRKDIVEQAWVVRETESYPTYFLGFKEPYDILKKELDKYSNLYPIGRGAMYKYNNQDHSILSGLLAARNYSRPKECHFNLWNINIDAEYHEAAARNV